MLRDWLIVHQSFLQRKMGWTASPARLEADGDQQSIHHVMHVRFISSVLRPEPVPAMAVVYKNTISRAGRSLVAVFLDGDPRRLSAAYLPRSST